MKNGDWENVIKRQPTYVHTYERRIGKTPNSLFLASVEYQAMILFYST